MAIEILQLIHQLYDDKDFGRAEARQSLWNALADHQFDLGPGLSDVLGNLSERPSKQYVFFSDGRSEANAEERRWDERPKNTDAEKQEFAAWFSYSDFRVWKMHLCRKVARGSNKPTQTTLCVTEIEKAKTLGQVSN